MSYEYLGISKRVADLAESLQIDYNLSPYESLDIAIKVEKNEYLARAFVLTTNDDVTALEKIVHTLEDLRKE